MIVDYIGASILIILGIYIMIMNKDTIKIILGLIIMGSGVNLFLISIGLYDPISFSNKLKVSDTLVLNKTIEYMVVVSIIITVCAVIIALSESLAIKRGFGKFKNSYKYIVVGLFAVYIILLATGLIYAEAISAEGITLNLNMINPYITPNGLSTLSIFAFGLFVVGFGTIVYLFSNDLWSFKWKRNIYGYINLVVLIIMTVLGIYGMYKISFAMYNISSYLPIKYLFIYWGCITIIYSIIMVILNWASDKRLEGVLKYLSISQIGLTIIGFGIASYESVYGSIYNAISIIPSIMLIFICISSFYNSAKNAGLRDIYGIGKKMPYTTLMFASALLSISGIPPFGQFESRYIIYNSALKYGHTFISIIIVISSIITFALSLNAIYNILFKNPKNKNIDNIKEANVYELSAMGILTVLSILLGVFPKQLNRFMPQIIKNEWLSGITLSAIGYNSNNFGILLMVLIIGIIVFILLNPEIGENISVSDIKNSFLNNCAKFYLTICKLNIPSKIKKPLNRCDKLMKDRRALQISDYILWAIGVFGFISVYLMFTI